MGIVYILSLLILVINFILVKKTEKKLNILSFIGITIGVMFCYNTFICYILTFFTIPVTLLNLSIINLLLALLLLFFILRKKQIQSYELKKIDLLYIALLGIVVLIVSYINFGFPFNIKYETGDPSVHYLTSEMFAENESLLVTAKDEVYGGFSTRKTVSYVNSGLIMKCFEGVIDSFDYYNIFIVFGIFVLFITAYAMYTTISAFSIDNKTRFLAFVVSLIYTIGYPLNSFLFGFEYLSMGIFLICLIFDAVYYFKNKELKTIYNIIILALLNFGLFCAYYMFVPFMYPALWIYFCIESYKKDKSIFTKKNILLLTTTLLIPFALGCLYHITPEIYRVFIDKGVNTEAVLDCSEYLVGKGFATYGYIYINVYSNMLLLLPIPIYLIIKKLKENKFAVISMIFCIAFIELLFIGNIFEKVSIYYISKNYFVLWFILMYLNYKGLVELYKKHSALVFEIVGAYIILIVITFMFSNVSLSPSIYNEDENIAAVTEIFGANKTILEDKKTDLYKEELEIIKYFVDNISYENKVEIVGDMEQGFWTYSLTRYVNKECFRKGQEGLERKMINVGKDIEDADYIIYFNRTSRYKRLEDKINKLGNTIFENEYGGIVKCIE